MMLTRRVIMGLAVGVLCFALSDVAQAQSIGVSFASNRGNPDAQLLPGERAGVVEQANWNVNDGGADAQGAANGATADIIGPMAGVLSDSNGAPTGATVTWTSNGTWNTNNGTATPNAKLMNGYIDAIGAADPFATVEIGNIPYDEYSVYVYIGSDGNGRTGAVTDGTTTYSYSTFSNDPDGSGGFDAGDFAESTDTASGNPNANYVVFSGSGSTASISIMRGSNNSGIHAIQIVNSGPPAAEVPLSPLPVGAVLVLGGALALWRRRRAAPVAP